VEFFTPISDENSRLVSQSGLFTRGPAGVDLESWTKKQFPSASKIKLMKIFLPDTDRDLALKALNRMNINHASLFPDPYGASKYCNFELEIAGY
jgi:hypothetical protein